MDLVLAQLTGNQSPRPALRTAINGWLGYMDSAIPTGPNTATSPGTPSGTCSSPAFANGLLAAQQADPDPTQPRLTTPTPAPNTSTRGDSETTQPLNQQSLVRPPGCLFGLARQRACGPTRLPQPRKSTRVTHRLRWSPQFRKTRRKEKSPRGGSLGHGESSRTPGDHDQSTQVPAAFAPDARPAAGTSPTR